MSNDTEEVCVGFAIPSRTLLEEGMTPPGIRTALACAPVGCGNPACPDGCLQVAVLVTANSETFSYRYATDVARKLGQSILDACDVQDAHIAKRAGSLN